MFTYTSIILRMFQIEMPLVLAPHEDYYVPPSINLRSRQTLNIHITAIPKDIGHLHLTFFNLYYTGTEGYFFQNHSLPMISVRFYSLLLIAFTNL